MSKLAPGMTVQMASAPWAKRRGLCVAWCARCKWESDPLTYTAALAVACNPYSHDCNPEEGK